MRTKGDIGVKGLRVPGGGKPGQLVADVGPVPAWGWVGGS